jgi:hypothetical protein
MTLTNGTYRATVNRAWLETVNAKSGAELLMAKIELLAGDDHEKITWGGFLSSEKSTAYVLKTLLTCGYSGKTEDDLANLSEAMLDQQKELEIVCEEDGDQDKTFLRVKWINEPRAARPVTTKDSAKTHLSKFNVAGMLAEERSKTKQPTPTKETKPVDPTSDEIPF